MTSLTLVGFFAVIMFSLFAQYAIRKHDKQQKPVTDDLALARSVRESFDNLPYSTRRTVGREYATDQSQGEGRRESA